MPQLTIVPAELHAAVVYALYSQQTYSIADATISDLSRSLSLDVDNAVDVLSNYTTALMFRWCLRLSDSIHKTHVGMPWIMFGLQCIGMCIYPGDAAALIWQERRGTPYIKNIYIFYYVLF